MCGAYYSHPTPPVSWLGCLFFVEFIELKKCVHHFCVHYLITIDWIWKDMIKRKPPISRGLYKRKLVFSSVGVERFELPTSCSQSRLRILYKWNYTSVSVVEIEPFYKQKTPQMWGSCLNNQVGEIPKYVLLLSEITLLPLWGYQISKYLPKLIILVAIT